ncbi:MAG: hypothetical protein IPO67_18530 [Deltaproteobacteria bacterium]|nr:hypothetical protein [Deltaproteobacteria bacterium]
MSTYYTREPGEEGNILTEEGEAPGVDLAALLARERPPLRVAIEIGSAIADILTIAEEDRALHGDIKPGLIKITADGAVAVEGFNANRRSTRAPEGKPVGHQTDVFGLGVILHSLLSAEPLGALPKDADAHDDAVITRVMAMDFASIEGKRWLEDVRKFLAGILAYHPDERPLPLDAANVLAQVASQCPGQSLRQWAAQVVPASGGVSGGRRPAAPVQEDLGGPKNLSGPLPKGATGAFKKDNRQAPSAKGESTAMWSKEKIAALMQAEDDESEEQAPPAKPTRGGRGGGYAQDEDLGGPAPVANKPKAPTGGFNSADDDFFNDEPAKPARSPFNQGPVAQGPGPIAQGPIARGPVITGPTPNSGGDGGDDEDEAPASGSKLKWVVIGAIGLFVACLGVLGVGGGAYYAYTNGMIGGATEAPEEVDIPTEVVDEPTEVEEPKPKTDKKGDTAAPAPEEAKPVEAPPPPPPPKVEPAKVEPAKVEPAKAPPKTTTTTSSGSTGSTGSKASTGTSGRRDTTTTTTTPPKTTTTTSSASSGGDGGKVEIKLAVMGSTARASVSCGDGQSQKFSGTTRMVFDGAQSCRIEVDGKRGAFTASKSGSVTCTVSGDVLNCS